MRELDSKDPDAIGFDLETGAPITLGDIAGSTVFATFHTMFLHPGVVNDQAIREANGAEYVPPEDPPERIQ